MPCYLALHKFRFILIGLFFTGAIFLNGFTSIAKRNINDGNSSTVVFAAIFHQSNLVSDLPGVALVEDRALINPWGVAVAAGLGFCVVNNGGAAAGLFRGGGSRRPPGPNSRA